MLLWLPANLVAKGYSMAVARQLLAASALIALPTVFAAAFESKRLSRDWQTSTLMRTSREQYPPLQINYPSVHDLGVVNAGSQMQFRH
jgi:hypothetical protein